MRCDAKRRAKIEGVPFNLNKNDFIIPNTCPVLGIPLKIGEGAASENSPSLDKHIPQLGYVASNVSVISSRANRLKIDATTIELEKILSYLKTVTNSANL